MKKIVYFFVLIFLCSCSKDKLGKYQGDRTNIIDVKQEVQEIPTENVLISSSSFPYIAGKYLLIGDYGSYDKAIHIFDAKSLKYITSAGSIGQGPNEITRLGTLAWNEKERDFYVTDHGKLLVFRFNIDSLLAEPLYQPTIKQRLEPTVFPTDYVYLNDTLSYGIFIKPTSVSTFEQTMGKWNMVTGQIQELEYLHPDVERKRISFALSLEYERYVECNSRYDLMSIFSLDGKLIWNVYGPNWDRTGDRKEHYTKVVICGNKIVAAYVGEDYNKRKQPTMCHIFTIDGDYLKTINVGYQIQRMCYDEDNDRLIFCFNDVIQYGYLNLKGVI